MNGETMQRIAAEHAEQLPGTQLENPFGPDADVYKVREKMFMMHTDRNGTPIIVLKATPAESQALREEFAEITPGYHMNKKHWITLWPGDGLDQQLIEDLVTESYVLVIEKNVPRRQWPVDPSTFGQRRG